MSKSLKGYSISMIKQTSTYKLTNLKHKVKANYYISLFSYSRAMCAYKTYTHLANCCKLKLANDIELNPGPDNRLDVVDSSKTISAPYIVKAMFGHNAGI